MAISKFQTGETRTIGRAEIRGAEYNPRTIDDAARKRLMKAIKKDGLIGTLIWNERTGNLVSGHQRLSILDQLEKNQDYALVVTVIDVDEHKEKALNVQMNNQSMQGDWDVDLLADLAADGVGFEEMGFSEADAEVLFGGDSRLSDMFHDSEEVTETKDKIREVKKFDRKECAEKLKKERTADFIVTLVCEDRDQKVALCKALRIPEYEQFAPAVDVMRRLGGA